MSFHSIAEGLKKSALSLSVIIMMNIFFNAGIAVFNPLVEYSDVCEVGMHASQEICEANEGSWISDKEGYGYCEENCWEKERVANKPIQQINFVVRVGLGVAALLAGALIVLPAALGNGLMYGGVLSILIGWAVAADVLDNVAHFVISGLLLCLLFWVGLKKMND